MVDHDGAAIFEPGWHFFGHWSDAGMHLDDLCDYVERLDEFIALSERHARENGPRHPRDFDDYLFAEPFPQILHSSLIIATIAFIEAEMKGYCGLIRRARELKLSMADLTGTPVKKFRLYVESVAGLDLRLSTELWEDIVELFELRHHFAHGQNSRSEKPPNTLMTLWQRRRPFDLDEEGRVVASKRTSLFAIDRAKEFLNSIYSVAQETYPREEV